MKPRAIKESTVCMAKRIAQKRYELAVRNLQRAKKKMAEARMSYERAVAMEEETRLEFERFCS